MKEKRLAIPKKYTLLTAALAFLVAAFQSCSSNEQAQTEQIPDQVSYNFDIRPILSDKCFACHGPDANKREAGLRLDVEADAFKALQDNPKAHALVAGKPESSELFLRVSTQDTSLIMPPTASKLGKLTQREVKLIEKWIRQGAKYEKHWAFVAPKSPALPKVKLTDWPKNEIDYFVLQKMEQRAFLPTRKPTRSAY